MARSGINGYTTDWPEIARAVKDEAGWTCVRCGHPHDIPAGYMLTVHHLDMDKANNRWWNTIPLCQRCHLNVQSRVNIHRPWVMFDHTPWFQIYVAGFYAWKYLGEELTREQVEQRLDGLLQLERLHTLKGSIT